MRRRQSNEEQSPNEKNKWTSAKQIKKRIKPISSYSPHVSMLVYGRAGTGKTTFAATVSEYLKKTEAEKQDVLILDVKDRGTDSISEHQELQVLPIESWADFEGVYWYLKEEDHPYGATIIDTITQLQNVAMTAAKERMGKTADDPMSKLAWGALSGMLAPKLLDFRDLPLHTIFVAQDRRTGVDEEDEIEDMLPEIGPALMPSVARDVNAMVKVIGNTFIKQRSKKTGGKIKKVSSYRLRLAPHPLYLCKIRAPKATKVPAYISDPTFEKIMNIMKGEVS